MVGLTVVFICLNVWLCNDTAGKTQALCLCSVANGGWAGNMSLSFGLKAGASLTKVSRNITWSHGNVRVCFFFLFPLDNPYLKPGGISFEKRWSHCGSWWQASVFVPLLKVTAELVGALLTPVEVVSCLSLSVTEQIEPLKGQSLSGKQKQMTEKWPS